MKKFLFFFLLLFAASVLNAQTLVFSENFDSPSNGDSVTATGTIHFVPNTRLHTSGNACDSAIVTANGTGYLTTNSFSTLGYSIVFLKFSHICKIEPYDFGTIEVSTNHGASWTTLDSLQYLNAGVSQFGHSGINYFNSATYYSAWVGGTNGAKPTQTWWQNENFDISSLVGNVPWVQIRFKLVDGNGTGAFFNRGWFIDDIAVRCGVSELNPPYVHLAAPLVFGNVYNTGPYDIYAKVHDASGIDTAYLVYKVNGGPDQYAPMHWLADSTYTGTIPSYTYGNTIRYHVHGVDASLSFNSANCPDTSIYIIEPVPSVVVGTGTTVNSNLPTNGNANYNWGCMIYKASELNFVGNIDSISFYVNNAVSNYVMLNQKVFIGYTNLNTIANIQPDTNSIANGVVVAFDDTITFNGQGWARIKLANPFFYDNTRNLMILWKNRRGTTASGYPQFRYTATTPNLAAYRANAAYNQVFPNGTGIATPNRPNIRIAYIPQHVAVDAGILQITEPSGTAFTIPAIPIKVKLKNFADDTLHYVTIIWSLDGVVQDSAHWVGLMAQDVITLPFAIDNSTFNVGTHTIKAWTYKPNGVIDPFHANDTAHMTFYACGAGVSGTYTIGAGGNFPTMTAALASMADCGVTGPVVYNILPGTYTGQVTIPAISGVSATNTITFQSSTGVNTDVTLQYAATSSTDNFVLRLNAANYIRIKNITIKSTSTSTYGNVVELIGGANNNRFEGNIIQSIVSTSTSTAGIYSYTTASDNFNVFQNNKIYNGFYGIFFAGDITSRKKGNQFNNNEITGWYRYGMYLSYNDSVKVVGNLLQNGPASTDNYHIYANFNNFVCKFLKNNIQSTGSGTFHGIEIENATLAAGYLNIIANNFISQSALSAQSTATGAGYGIYLYSAYNTNVYYNSVNITGPSTSGCALYQPSNASGINIVDNILINTGGGYSIYLLYPLAITNSDYNDLYVTGTNLGYYNGANEPTLAAWKLASSKDLNSVSGNPGFLTSTDLHTHSALVIGKGTPLAPQITDDIDGDVRSALPTIGADEAQLLPYDLTLSSMVAPTSSCSLSATENVTIKIVNTGQNALSNIDVYYVMTPPGTVVHETIAGPINTASFLNYTFANHPNMSAPGNYTFTFYIHHASDQNIHNDTIYNQIVKGSWNFNAGAYTQGFESNEDYSDWTDINTDASAYKWVYPYNSSTYAHTGANSAQFNNATTNVGEDWLFSRCFNLQAGKTYDMSFWYRANSATYPQNITLKYGNSPSAAAMSTTLAALTSITNTVYQQSTNSFVAPTTGTYYFGWLGVTGYQSSAYIDDINLKLIPDQEASLIEITQPATGCNLTANEPVSIKIKNNGVSAINSGGSLMAYYQVGTGTIISAPVNPVTPIQPNSTYQFTFPTTINMVVTSSDATFNIKAWISLVGDPFHYNDTLTKSVISNHSTLAPVVTNANINMGQTAILHANSPTTVYWFNDNSTTTSFHTDTLYTTPPLFNTTTYYVEANPAIVAVDKLIGPGTGTSTALPINDYYNYAWSSSIYLASELGFSAGMIDTIAFYVTIPTSGYSMNNQKIFMKNITNSTFSAVTNPDVANMISVFQGTLGWTGPGWNKIALNPPFHYDGNNLEVALENWSGNYYIPYPYYPQFQTHTVGSNMVKYAYQDSPGFPSGAGYGTYTTTRADTRFIRTPVLGCPSPRVPVTAHVYIPPSEVATTEIITPVSGCTFGTEKIKAKFVNNGTVALTTPYTVGYHISGSLNTVTETISDAIQPGGFITHEFAVPANMPVPSGSVTYTVTVFINTPIDNYLHNDTLTTTVTLNYSPPAPTVTNSTVPYGTSDTLTAISPNIVKWYTDTTTGTILHTGSTYITGNLYQPLTYYATATNLITATTTVGTSASNNSYLPFSGGYNYSWSSSLYLANQLGFSGNIDTIAYYVDNTISGYTTTDQRIYLNQVYGSVLADQNYPNVASMTQVYSGPITWKGPGWVKIPLSAPFYYDGIKNLEVTYENHYGTYTAPNPSFRVSTVPANMVKYKRQDSGFPVGAGVAANLRPNTEFIHSNEGCPSPFVPVTVSLTNQPQNDAGVNLIIDPVTPTTLGNHNVTVKVQNYGSNTLAPTIPIHYNVNGGTQTIYNWSGSILPGQYANVTFPLPHNFTYIPYPGKDSVVAWTEYPGDPTHANDTAYKIVYAHNPLNGVYYIRTSNPDFNSFTDAVAALMDWGVSGPVTIKADTGVYTEHISLGLIPGASATNTVTFQSITNVNTDVKLQYAATGNTNNYVVQLNGTQYVKFKNINIKSISTAGYGKVIDLISTSSNDIFDGNKIEGLVVTSATSTPVNCEDVLCSNITFSNNKILNGYEAVHINGSASGKIKGFKFLSNDISNYYLNGFFLNYTDSVKVVKNKLSTASVNATNYAVNASYCDNNSRFEQNNITYSGTGTFYGLLFANVNATATLPDWVANNFVSNTGSSGGAYGISLNTCNYMNVDYNSVNIAAGTGSSTRDFNLSGGSSNVNIMNNNFANVVGGYTLYVATPSVVSNTDHNNLYTTGTTLAYWNADMATLTNLQNTSLKNTSSLSLTPGYVSATDLHTTQFLLSHNAVPIPGITVDYDGSLRSATTPCIGAHEYNPPLNDVGVSAILPPTTTGSQMMQVKIYNYGTSTAIANSITVHFAIGGNVQAATYVYPNAILGSNETTFVPTTNITIPSGYLTLQAWTSKTGDANIHNDTTTLHMFVCNGAMSGTYTIGTGGNYPTFTDAITAMNQCGVGGPVTFNVISGTYNERINLGLLPGVSSTNTVTFQSATGNNNDVIVQAAGNATTNNYVIQMNGSKYVKFKNMTIKSTTPSVYGTVISLTGNTDYNVFDNNKIQSITTTDGNSSVIYSASGNVDFNKFTNNKIKGGYYGVYFYGVTTAFNKGNEFSNDSVSGWYYSGFYLSNNDSIIVRGNTLINGSNATEAYSITSSNGNNGCRYEKNHIFNTNTGTTNGIALITNTGTATEPTWVVNNMVSEINGTGYAYGIVLSSSNYANVYFNSVNINGGNSASGRALFTAGGNNIKVVNNNLVNTGPGYAYYNQSATIAQSDYNNIFTTSSVYAHWTSDVATLTALKAQNLMDVHSVTVNPGFVSTTDLHATSVSINGKATNIPGITDDIDGDNRNATTPDIGADEFTPTPLDLAIIGFVQPSVFYSAVGGQKNVEVQIKNLGSSNVSSFTISYRYTLNGNVVTANWAGLPLAPDDVVNYAFTVPFTVQVGAKDLCAWVHLVGDAIPANDSLCTTYKGIPVLMVPSSDDFESSNVFYSEGTNNDWEYGTPSSTNINTAHSPTHCWKTNLDGNYSDNEVSYLYSPYYNFSQVADATLDFWHNYNTQAGQDGGRIQYFITGLTPNWVNLGYVNPPTTTATNWYNSAIASGANTWNGNSGGWIHSTFNLSTVSSPSIVNATAAQPVQFRFVFESNASTNSDGWAVDDFSITAPQLAKDAGVTAIVLPSGSTQIGAPVTVKVTIHNYGTDTMQAIPVRYRVNGGSPYLGEWTGVLNAGDDVDYQFVPTFNTPGLPYTLCAYTSRPGDIYSNNDTTCAGFGVTPADHDVGVIALVFPVNGPNPVDTVVSGVQSQVKIRIKNFGNLNETNIPVTYYMFGGSPIGAGTWSGVLKPDSTAEFLFTTPLTIPFSNFNLCAKTSLSTDVNTLNDPFCNTYYGYVGINTYEYSQWDLMQNVPNPANNSTIIGFDIPADGKVRIEIVDLLGNSVFVDEKEYHTGTNQVEIDVKSMPAGIYFYSARYDNMVRTKRMVITK